MTSRFTAYKWSYKPIFSFYRWEKKPRGFKQLALKTYDFWHKGQDQCHFHFITFYGVEPMTI